MQDVYNFVELFCSPFIWNYMHTLHLHLTDDRLLTRVCWTHCLLNTILSSIWHAFLKDLFKHAMVHTDFHLSMNIWQWLNMSSIFTTSDSLVKAVQLSAVTWKVWNLQLSVKKKSFLSQCTNTVMSTEACWYHTTYGGIQWILLASFVDTNNSIMCINW